MIQKTVYEYHPHYILSSVKYISREHRDFVSIIDVQAMARANDWVHYGLRIVLVCLHITLSIIIIM